MTSAFIRSVTLKNYKSIASCKVELHPLTFLVGPNGSGKSNFLDALRLVADALNNSLDHALRDRGGIKEVRRKSSGHPTHFTIELEFSLGDGSNGEYGFTVGAQPQGGYEVQTETCTIRSPIALQPAAFYKIEAGELKNSSLKVAPPASSDRLYLVNAAGIPEFLPLYEALTHMGFYNLNPDRIRDLQQPDRGEVLRRDGSNLPSVLGQLDLHNGALKKRIEDYLSKVVPGVSAVQVKSFGPKETLEFRQHVKGANAEWRFISANMSDGTLRALGILVALFQAQASARIKVPLVGIEEPETALHPAAAGILRDALREASAATQVLVTSHSPDLLDDASISENSILAVSSDEGVTKIAPPDDAGKSAIKDRLYTAGELLRMNQLTPQETPQNGVSEPHLFEAKN